MSEEKGEKHKIEENVFETLEKDFQEVLHELMGEKSLEKFRIEYEKLLKALKKSHEGERRLMSKCRELNADIVANSTKVAAALKLSQDDQSTIASLKQEIEKAWKMVDAAHDKEQKAKDTIQSLKQEIGNLSKLVEQGAGLSVGQEYSINDLIKIKEALTEERDQLLSEVVKLRESLTEAASQQKKAEDAKQEAIEAIDQLQQDIQVRKNESSQETRRKEKMEKELKQLQADLDAKQIEVKQLQHHQQKNKDEQAKLEQMLKEQKILNERASKEMEQVVMRNTKLQQDIEHQSLSYEQVLQENQQLQLDIKAELQKMKQQAEENKQLIENQEGEERRLLKIISEADAKCLRQQEELDQVNREQDILIQVSVQQNDELLLLYEKIQIQQSALNKGENQYRQRVEDIRLLKLENKRLRREKGILNKSVTNVEELRQKLDHTQRELLKERTRCRALEEKLEKLKNEHRWRKLQVPPKEGKVALPQSTIQQPEQTSTTQQQPTTSQHPTTHQQQLPPNTPKKNNPASSKPKRKVEEKTNATPEASDPSKCELIQKIHVLQKQLIRKKNEWMEKELLLQEKEKLRVELEHKLAQQHGSEAEQIELYQNMMREKTKAVEELSSIVNMYKSQNQEYKHQHEILSNELQNVKKKCFIQKRKEQQASCIMGDVNTPRKKHPASSKPKRKAEEKTNTITDEPDLDSQQPLPTKPKRKAEDKDNTTMQHSEEEEQQLSGSRYLPLLNEGDSDTEVPSDPDIVLNKKTGRKTRRLQP